MLTIQKNLTAINRTVKASRNIKYIVVHYTGNVGDTAYNNTKYFKSEYRGSSAHYFVDESSIWQCVEDKDVAWHCGAKKYYHAECRNANAIGVEMCNSVSRNLAVEKNTAELVRYLMDKYNIDIDHVVRHYDVTHKRCPAELVDNGEWIDFRSKIVNGGNDEMTEAEKAKVRAIDKSLSNLYRIVQGIKERNPVYKTIADVPDWGKGTVQKLIDSGVMHGDENGDINVSEDMLRGMVIMGRMLEKK